MYCFQIHLKTYTLAIISGTCRSQSSNAGPILRNFPLFGFLGGLVLFFYIFYVYQAQNAELNLIREQMKTEHVQIAKLKAENIGKHHSMKLDGWNWWKTNSEVSIWSGIKFEDEFAVTCYGLFVELNHIGLMMNLQVRIVWKVAINIR